MKKLMKIFSVLLLLVSATAWAGTARNVSDVGPQYLYEVSACPTAIPNFVIVCAKEVSGNTEFFIKDSAGNEIQVSNGGSLNVPVVLDLWGDDTANLYPDPLRNLLLPKLGTATVGTQSYNSATNIFQGSAWDTDDSVARVTEVRLTWEPYAFTTVGGILSFKHYIDGVYVNDMLRLDDAGGFTFSGAGRATKFIAPEFSVDTGGMTLDGDGFTFKNLSNDTIFSISTAGVLTPENRVLGKQGTNITAANDITLGSGNYFFVDGATQINRIASAGWTVGSIIYLEFNDNPVIADETAGDATYASIVCDTSNPINTATGSVVKLLYNGTVFKATLEYTE